MIFLKKCDIDGRRVFQKSSRVEVTDFIDTVEVKQQL